MTCNDPCTLFFILPPRSFGGHASRSVSETLKTLESEVLAMDPALQLQLWQAATRSQEKGGLFFFCLFPAWLGGVCGVCGFCGFCGFCGCVAFVALPCFTNLSIYNLISSSLISFYLIFSFRIQSYLIYLSYLSYLSYPLYLIYLIYLISSYLI